MKSDGAIMNAGHEEDEEGSSSEEDSDEEIVEDVQSTAVSG